MVSGDQALTKRLGAGSTRPMALPRSRSGKINHLVLIPTCLTLSPCAPNTEPQHQSGVKITRGPWVQGPYLVGRPPRSSGLVSRQTSIHFRGLHIEIEKDINISKPGPEDSDKGPKNSMTKGPTGSYKEEPYFHPCQRPGRSM